MRTRFLFNPLLVFILPSVVALIMWWTTPYDWLVQWKVTEIIKFTDIVAPWCVAFVAFVIGYFAQKNFVGDKNSHPSSRKNLFYKFQISTGLLICFCMAILLGNLVVNYGFGSVFARYQVRAGYVGGVTTYILLTTAAILVPICYAYMVRSAREVWWSLVGLILVFAIYRAFWGSERLALILPAVAAGISYIIVKYRSVSFKQILQVALILLFVVILFVFAEYFRSYLSKLNNNSNIEVNPILYGVQRLWLYFSLSVNAGGAEYLTFTDGSGGYPLFSQTFKPMSVVAYQLLDINPINLSGGQLSGTTILEDSGLYNPEFNNRWGVVTPFLEGWPVGILFWFIWGAVASYAYRRAFARNRDYLDVAMYALLVTALIDNQSRTGLLGAPHFLVPFCWIIFWRFLLNQNTIRHMSFQRRPMSKS